MTRSDQPKNAAKKNRAHFKGVPKYSPINTNTLGLIRSPRIANVKKNQLDPYLNRLHAQMILLTLALKI